MSIYLYLYIRTLEPEVTVIYGVCDCVIECKCIYACICTPDSEVTMTSGVCVCVITYNCVCIYIYIPETKIHVHLHIYLPIHQSTSVSCMYNNSYCIEILKVL